MLLNADVDHAGQILKEKREDKDLTQTEVAVRGGLSLSSLQKAERYERFKVGRRLLLKIAAGLEEDPKAFLEWALPLRERKQSNVAQAERTSDNDEAEDDEPPPGGYDIGLAGTASRPQSIDVQHSLSATGKRESLAVSRGKVIIPDSLDGEWAIMVDGQSMEPDYPDRSIALFKWQPGEGQQFTFGQEYFIEFDDGDCYFSRVLAAPKSKDKIILRKINPDRQRFPDREIVRKHIRRSAICLSVTIKKSSIK